MLDILLICCVLNFSFTGAIYVFDSASAESNHIFGDHL